MLNASIFLKELETAANDPTWFMGSLMAAAILRENGPMPAAGPVADPAADPDADPT